MAEVAIGAFLIAAIAYTAGFFTGQYISRRRTNELRKLYAEVITSAKYVSDVVAAKEERNHYYDNHDE